jgi:antitoxin FitA
MATVTVKNLPDELHQKLRESAKLHHRSINNEIIALLESKLHPQRVDTTAMLAEIRKFRESLNVYLDHEDVQRLKEEGRM